MAMKPCMICGVEFDARGCQKVCPDEKCYRTRHLRRLDAESAKRKQKQERGRPGRRACRECGREFQPLSQNHWVGHAECRARIDKRRANDWFTEHGATKVERVPAPKPRRARIPCASCRHGRPSSAAEMGWECGITQALRCQPLSPAPRLYSARLEEA